MLISRLPSTVQPLPPRPSAPLHVQNEAQHHFAVAHMRLRRPQLKPIPALSEPHEIYQKLLLACAQTQTDAAFVWFIHVILNGLLHRLLTLLETGGVHLWGFFLGPASRFNNLNDTDKLMGFGEQSTGTSRSAAPATAATAQKMPRQPTPTRPEKRRV